MDSIALRLSPHGRLTIVDNDSEQQPDPELALRLRSAFGRGAGHGLLLLGLDEAGSPLPPVFSWWREFGARYVTTLCALHENDASKGSIRIAPPSVGDLEALAGSAHL